MSPGEAIAVITAAGALITGIISVIVSALTSRSAARKDFVALLHSTVETLQQENQRLFLRLQEYESKLAKLDAVIENRDERIVILENSLRDATQSSIDRAKRIIKLKKEIQALQARVNSLENGQPK